MERILFPLMPLLAMIMAFASCGAVPRQSSPLEEARVSEALAARHYAVEVRRAEPIGWRTIDLDTGYGITVRGDSLFSRLPYFGRAYSVPYGAGEGLVFEAPIESYQAESARGGRTDITLHARTAEDSYTYYLTVWENGEVRLDVDSFNRQNIAYDGRIE